MKLKKIYVEITNACNFHCGFCFKTERAARFMSVEEFRIVAEKIRPFTDHVYLHVLGEPLVHPGLDEILSVAESAGLKVNIDTNGSLLIEKEEILLKHKIRQVVISLHDAEENIPARSWDGFFQAALDFTVEIAPKTYVALRLWNVSEASSVGFNALILKKIMQRFEVRPEQLEKATRGNGTALAHHIYLQLKPRFQWPGKSATRTATSKTCYALRDHIAILAGGEIVPCCMDANGEIMLGNVFKDDLLSALKAPRAQKIKEGFKQRRIVEPLCGTCGFFGD